MLRIEEIISGLLWLFLPVLLMAQPELTDFEDIPQEHWEINSFEEGSSLGAIVLFDAPSRPSKGCYQPG